MHVVVQTWLRMDAAVVPPSVQYDSIQELWQVCNELFDAYASLTRAEIDRIVSSRSNRLAWSEYDRLMLGLASFDELTEHGLHIVLESTKWRGTLYAHDLNRRIANSLNFSNSIFFHRTSSVDVGDLHTSIFHMLERILLTSHQSHFHAMKRENFASMRNWDGEEWLVCPKHTVHAYKEATFMSQHKRLGANSLLYLLPEDILFECLRLVGIIQERELNPWGLEPHRRLSGSDLPDH